MGQSERALFNESTAAFLMIANRNRGPYLESPSRQGNYFQPVSSASTELSCQGEQSMLEDLISLHCREGTPRIIDKTANDFLIEYSQQRQGLWYN